MARKSYVSVSMPLDLFNKLVARKAEDEPIYRVIERLLS